MSDEKTTAGGPEEELVERLLSDLEQGRAVEGAEPTEAAAERRAYLELLGLVGASVPARQPSPGLERRLMSALPVGAARLPAPAGARSATGARWLLPLAASLAVVLAGFSVWQSARISAQGATIERLTQRLQEVEERSPAAAGLRVQLGELQARLAMVTRRGTEVCLLRPMPAAPSADSRGVLFVAADHQHWYLTLEGLTPCAEGRSYQLWFVPAGGRPVSAGTFDVVAGTRVELSSAEMPADTRAVTVTLEPAGGSDAPTGPAVLHGDEVMAIL